MTDIDPSASEAINPSDCRRAATLASHAITKDVFGYRLVVAEAAAEGRVIELLRAFTVLVFDALGADDLRTPEKLEIIRRAIAKWTDREQETSE
ncbi:hypothetical protein LAUMK136_05599 [Mycobacterium attenuatum]|uniref:Uncharacterized protein n=1 Tax=Mycobacterium attenuatum TaxID=2341086 RepID=A0A498QHZ0_9MYCO|nr:hypothetical protein [Mycobacterium attenuatum]VBA44354.1 hypothetical protein LAUMK136_05599 [Mycobacterium attenuatum]